MDLIIIGGISKVKGSQYSLKQKVSLIKDGALMTYANLQRYFGHNDPTESSDPYTLHDYNTPYLAGIYLYNFLTKRGINCELINFLDLEINKFERLLQQNPKAIALSTTFLTSIKSVKEVTKIIREYDPVIKIIVGGQLVNNSYLIYQLKDTDYDTSSCAQDYFFISSEKYYYEDIDLFIVEDQGEATLYQLTKAIKNCQDYSGIPNLAFYKDNRLIFTSRDPEENDFAEDLICWDEVPEEYLYPIFPMRGSRGCPYKCQYCNFPSGKRFRLKGSDILAQEIAALRETEKVRMIRFTDDNLFLTRRHVEEYCRMIIEVGKGIKWTSFIRAGSITKDNVKLLKDSGCVMAQIGMESGDRSILNKMNKKDTPENYLRVIELLNTHGISTQLYFIIGFPGETAKTIENTIQLLNQFHHDGPAINFIMVFPFLLAPLSPIYSPENRQKYNLEGYVSNWSHNTMNSKQAGKYATEFLFRLENLYPFYGIDELESLEMAKLKKLSQFRSKVHKAELFGSDPEAIEQMWQELRDVVTAD